MQNLCRVKDFGHGWDEMVWKFVETKSFCDKNLSFNTAKLCQRSEQKLVWILFILHERKLKKWNQGYFCAQKAPFSSIQHIFNEKSIEKTTPGAPFTIILKIILSSFFKCECHNYKMVPQICTTSNTIWCPNQPKNYLKKFLRIFCEWPPWNVDCLTGLSFKNMVPSHLILMTFHLTTMFLNCTVSLTTYL